VNGIDSVDALVDALEVGATVRDGEDLDLLAHSLQCAALLEIAAPADVELQLAGLVHDVGTLLEPGHPRAHAPTGAAAVRALLGERVAELVAHHDEAKRYLVACDPSYRDRLSARSLATLEAQGGPLTDEEQRSFLRRPESDACLVLRHADDAAKVPGRVVPPLEHWRDALAGCAAATRRH
jgi:predicted HD phosphohydrolase